MTQKKRIETMRKALEEIARMAGVRGRWIDGNGCAIESEDNDGTDKGNPPEGVGIWYPYNLEEQNSAMETINERALQALEATKEGA